MHQVTVKTKQQSIGKCPQVHGLDLPGPFDYNNGDSDNNNSKIYGYLISMCKRLGKL